MWPDEIRIIDGFRVVRYVDPENHDIQDFLVCPCMEWDRRRVGGELRPMCHHTRRWTEKRWPKSDVIYAP